MKKWLAMILVAVVLLSGVAAAQSFETKDAALLEVGTEELPNEY
jgi:hypothetical protein